MDDKLASLKQLRRTAIETVLLIGQVANVAADAAEAVIEIREKKQDADSAVTMEAVNQAIYKAITGTISVPIGTIVAWAKTVDEIPQGWHICDGTEGTIDLRDKFMLGAGNTYAPNASGGAEEVTLTVEQMPEHTHPAMILGHSGAYIPKTVTEAYQYPAATFTWRSIETDAAGGGVAHENMPPYVAVIFIQKISESPATM